MRITVEVLGAGVGLPNANKAFYRVVAVDDKGKRSGPSDYAAAPRPFIFSKPPDAAKIGTEFRYQVAAIRSLGDLRLRIVEGKEVASFWDIEKPRFVLVQGPSWRAAAGPHRDDAGVPARFRRSSIPASAG